MNMAKVKYQARTERVVKTKSNKNTMTAHLNLNTHALGKFYAGYVLNREGRQLNTAEAIDELSIAGALVKMPREMLESSGFEVPPA
jgi:hypothetical protein